MDTLVSRDLSKVGREGQQGTAIASASFGKEHNGSMMMGMFEKRLETGSMSTDDGPGQGAIEKGRPSGTSMHCSVLGIDAGKDGRVSRGGIGEMGRIILLCAKEEDIDRRLIVCEDEVALLDSINLCRPGSHHGEMVGIVGASKGHPSDGNVQISKKE